MDINPFVFSNKPSYKFARHAAFWTAWILYYAIISSFSFAPKYGWLRALSSSFTEVSLSTPLDMCFCYFIIYFLFPRYFFKGRYITMLLLWLLASILFMIGYELNARFMVPTIRGWFDIPTAWHKTNYVMLFFSLFSQINMEGCIAASIKLGKLWYVKQHEVELLKQEREKIDPHLDKGMMHPAFLADLLTRLELMAETKPLIVAKSIKKIRALVLNLMYENATRTVLLKDELVLLNEYIELEEITADENLEVKKEIRAEATVESIAPFIILPVVENAFRQVYMQPLAHRWIKINIELKESVLTMHLTWNKPVDTSTMAKGRNVIIQNISKRLQLIYPQSHELKIFIEVEVVRVHLTIELGKAINR